MWSDGTVQRRHFYYLSWADASIALQADVLYRVISSKVMRKQDDSVPEGCIIEVHHLLQEIK